MVESKKQEKISVWTILKNLHPNNYLYTIVHIILVQLFNNTFASQIIELATGPVPNFHSV